jgi:hypothetical protein
MAYDVADGRVVLFGGGTGNGGFPFGDTWTWDGNTWTRSHPEHSPSARGGTQMAYDAADGQVVLFGGDSSVGRQNDTWTWDGTDWTQRHPAHSPPVRQDAGIAYDAADGRVVLFGGLDLGGHHLGDTWTWDGTDWTQQHPAHQPGPRTEQAMAYDDADGRVVLFGGFSSHDLGDTWTWDGTDWTRQHPAHAPHRRFGAGLAYDAANSGVVLFGGWGCTCQDFDVRGDTWTWNGTDWTPAGRAHSPQPRADARMAYAADGRVLLFGGMDARHFFGDTWTWDAASWTKHPAESISLTPESGPPGTTVQIAGRGFTGFERVELEFQDSTQGVTVLKIVAVRWDGQFAAHVEIPGGATPGRQHIVARGSLGKETAKQSFTVT